MRRLLFISAFLLYFLIPSTNAYAFCVLCTPCNSGQNDSSVCTPSPNGNPNPIYGPGGVISNIINLISVIAGIVAVFAIFVAGFMFITSGGDPQKVNSAKNTIIFVIVGIVVIAIAQIVVVFVINKIGS